MCIYYVLGFSDDLQQLLKQATVSLFTILERPLLTKKDPLLLVMG